MNTRLFTTEAQRTQSWAGSAVCCLLSAVLLLTGCATWEGLSPGAQAAIKAAAKVALSLGVNQLGDRVKELRPYQGKLNTLIETTFARPLDAEALGAALKQGVVAEVPAEHRAAVLAEFKAQLADKAVAAGPQTSDRRPQTQFNARLAAAL